MSNPISLATLQSDSITLHASWTAFLNGEGALAGSTSDFFKAGLSTLGPLLGKDKAGNEVARTYGLAEFFKGVFSGNALLIPPTIQSVLDATRSDKVKDGEAVTLEGTMKNRWGSMLSTLQAGPKADKVKADEIATIKAALIRLLGTREDETVAMLASIGFADDRIEGGEGEDGQ